MAKKNLAEDGMSEAVLDDLRREHRAMIVRRMTGPGDSEGAMHRLDREHGLPFWSQWNFQYKRDRQPAESFVNRLRQAAFVMLRKSVETDLAKLKIEAAKQHGDADLARLQAEAEDVLARIRERLSQ
jgi:hypothetical protein